MKDPPSPFNLPRPRETYSRLLRRTLFGLNAKLAWKVMIRCDQTASSFPIKRIEFVLHQFVFPFYTNTHSNNAAGQLMSRYVDEARHIVMRSVGGSCQDDLLVFSGSGASGAVCHLVHMLGSGLKETTVFVSGLEHLSNYLPWTRSCVSVKILPTDTNGMIDAGAFAVALRATPGKKLAALTACSNVSGVLQDTHGLAVVAHKHGCPVMFDFAASAPYVDVDMNRDPKHGDYFDAIVLSPHKLPGGQGAPGVLIVKRRMVEGASAFVPGGGTVRHVSRFTGITYSNSPEVRQSGGTPNILGIFRAGLAFLVKSWFASEIYAEELKLTRVFQSRLETLEREFRGFQMLNPRGNMHRLPIFIVRITGMHPNLIVAMLSDRFGVLTRGGVNCAPLAADDLLGLTKRHAESIRAAIVTGRGTPPEYGWVRVTLCALHTDADLDRIEAALRAVCRHGASWAKRYVFDPASNTFSRRK